MKNKILALLLIGTVLCCTACGNSTSNDAEQEELVVEEVDEVSETNDFSDFEALGDIEVDDGIFSVEIHIPADFVGDTTQEELDQKAEENGWKSATLNEDGTATYVMTKKQHKLMLEEFTESMNETLQEMVGSEDYPNITAVEANKNFTEFTVTTSSTELDLAESFSVLAFYMYGGMYSIFSGDEVDNIHVTFKNADSGEIISESNSRDMADSE